MLFTTITSAYRITPSDEAQVTFTTTNGATNVPSGGLMVPMAGTATPPIPDEPPGNWFNHYWENLWIVQVFNCKVVLKEQTCDGKVTQVNWVVRIPKKHDNRKLKVKSI